METEILHLVEGAKKATGVTIIIDVFRAFSLEATAFEKGCEKGVLTGTVEEAFAIKKEHPDWLLFGERDGRKVEGFDYGNAPSAIENRDLSHKTFIHTTTNGVQGIVNAVHATDISERGSYCQIHKETESGTRFYSSNGVEGWKNRRG